MTAFRAASELLLVFGILCLLPFSVPGELIVLTVCLCSFACALAYLLREKPVLRYGCALLPLLVLPAVGQHLAVLLPLGYAQMLICTDRLFTSYWSYSRHMRFSLFAVAFGVVIAGIQGDRGIAPATCFLGYLFFGACFLRQLRLGQGVSLKGKLSDFAAVAAVPGLVALIGGLLVGGVPYYYGIVMAIFSFFGYLFQALIGFLVMITPTEMPSNPTVPTESTLPQVSLPAEYVPTEPIEQKPNIAVASDFWLYLLIAAVLIALAILAIVWLVRLLHRPAGVQRGNRWVDDSSKFTEIEDSAQQVDANRRKIRKIYGKYLTLMRSKGFRRQRQDTSRDILESTRGVSEDALCAQLRSLYIRARYAAGEKVTAQDVQNAKQLYRKIKDSLIAQ